MPLDRKPKKPDAKSFSSQASLSAIMKQKHNPGLTYGAGNSDGNIDDTSGKNLAAGNGTSIFDPVLTELAYRWFSPSNSVVLDPFAGGSVRGIVAAVLGRSYIGVDLRAEQIEANNAQWDAIKTNHNNAPDPVWITGDSIDVLASDQINQEADFIFSCPPYADLEVYSDDPKDLSTMEYTAFREAYSKIIALAVAKLKQDRFACFVVGEVRSGKDGAYVGFVPDTIKAFENAGARFYNEAILITMVGSLPIRTRRQFNAGRKMGKTHQNVLVFVKGCPKKATAACGDIEFVDIPNVPNPSNGL